MYLVETPKLGVSGAFKYQMLNGGNFLPAKLGKTTQDLP
jgi:hypothetical protein